MNENWMSINDRIIAQFMNGDDFEDEPEQQHQKLSRNEQLMQDFINGTGEFAE